MGVRDKGPTNAHSTFSKQESRSGAQRNYHQAALFGSFIFHRCDAMKRQHEAISDLNPNSLHALHLCVSVFSCLGRQISQQGLDFFLPGQESGWELLWWSVTLQPLQLSNSKSSSKQTKHIRFTSCCMCSRILSKMILCTVAIRPCTRPSRPCRPAVLLSRIGLLTLEGAQLFLEKAVDIRWAEFYWESMKAQNPFYSCRNIARMMLNRMIDWKYATIHCHVSWLYTTILYPTVLILVSGEK